MSKFFKWTWTSLIGGPSALAFLVALTVAFYLFVFKQWSLVSHPLGFVFLIVILIAAAFLSSATEQAFAIAPTNLEIMNAIDAAQKEMADSFKEIDDKINSVGSADLPDSDERKREKLMRKNRRLKQKNERLRGSGREIVIGSLATASVFLNTGLTAFLPLTIYSNLPNSPTINLPYPLIANEKFAWAEISFTSPKLLVFVASAIPVLLLGKIIPKIIGLRYPSLFAYRWHVVGAISTILFGWVTLGILQVFRLRAQRELYAEVGDGMKG